MDDRDATSQRATTSALQPGQPVGLVAGWGRLPLAVAQALRHSGYRVYCLAVAGEADPRLAQWCDVFCWIGLGKLGRAIRFFRNHGITDATMAGKIHKTFMFRPWFILRNLPDWKAISVFFPFFVSRRRDCRDDSLLGCIVDVFASAGIRFRPATEFAPGLLIKQGRLTKRGPSAAQLKDIQFGWKVAKQLGGLDIGQSVAVKNQAVLAVEAVEGTDQCIRRAGLLCPSGNFTVVKVAKPQQDMRFDVPTVGPATLETMIDSGAAVLAVEAERTIVLDRPELIELADQLGLVVVALDPMASPLAAEADHSGSDDRRVA